MKQHTQNRFLVAVLIFGAMLIGSWPQAVLAQLSCPVIQITNTTAPAASNSPSINADGTRIPFSSRANLTGNNADGNTEVFLFDTTTNTFTQVTNTTEPAFNTSATIDASGVRIALSSNANLTGNNADGNTEFFLFDTTTNAFTQVTNTTAAFLGGPSISANGTRTAFSSNANLTGNNADGNREIFLFDTTTNTFTQAN